MEKRWRFPLITASIRRGMEVISLWHCWGGMEAQVSLTVAFSSSAFFGLLFLIFLLTIPHDSLWGSGLVSLLASQAHQHHGHLTFGAFGSVCRCQILLENEISIFKKLVSRRKHEVLQNFLVNGCSDVGFQKHNGPTPADDIATQIITDCGNLTLDFMQLGLWASPPFLQTLGPLVSKWNTKLALIWKEDFGPLGNSPVLLLLSPGKTPLTLSVVQEWLNKRNTTTVAKFLDTSVCGGSWCLDPSLSPFLVKFTQILESILLDNPHKAAVLSVGCASFSSTLFPSTQLC